MPAEQDNQDPSQYTKWSEDLTKALEAYVAWENEDYMISVVKALAAFEKEVYGDAS